MNWQPIATAPRDGNPVDLWVKATGCEFRIPDFKWRDNQWMGLMSDEPISWHFCNAGMEVTHWMPKPGKPDSDYVVIDVKSCARCGLDHDGLSFSRLTHASGNSSHWASCPKNGQPILLSIVDSGTTTETRQGVARAKDETI